MKPSFFFANLLVLACLPRFSRSAQCWSCSEPWTNPCLSEPLKSTKVCDTKLSNDERIGVLVGILKPDEKVGLLSNGALNVTRLNIPAYQWWSEALHGVGGSPGVTFNGSTPFATSFPQVVATSSSFNKTLFFLIGQAIGIEGRAFFNNKHAGLTFWTPNINIFRDPRWGRGQETPGEDPFLTSSYAEQFPSGFQGGESYPKYLKGSSCCKHYSGYDLEDWDGVDRHHFDAIITGQDMNDTYFPSFQSCVQKGEVSSIMCSYNSVNGVPSCVNSGLLNGQLRETWGFNGYITSDCQAVTDVLETHNYTRTNDSTIVDTLAAGMDSDCGDFFEKHLQGCVDKGVCDSSVLDPALTNLFRVQFRLGLYDPEEDQPYSKLGINDINTDEHQKLALEAAEQGIVLLKNLDATLPLSAGGVKTLAVIGPNGNATDTLLGNYQGVPQYVVSPLEGIARHVTDTTFAAGCDNTACGNTTGFPAAVQAAAESDQVVLVLGIDQSQEKEGLDRYEISLPGEQEELIALVTQAAKNPIVVVVIGGGCVDLSSLKKNDNVGAILWTGYNGQSGGTAIGNTIFGDNVPSGRLTQTFYEASFIHEVSMFDMGMRPNAKTGNPGRGYRFYTGEPVYKFGAGLSYSRFAYSWSGNNSNPPARVVVDSKTNDRLGEQTHNDMLAADRLMPVVNISFQVENLGPFDASEVVLGYLLPPPQIAGKNGVPLKFLRYFERVQTTINSPTNINLALRPGDLRIAGGTDGAMHTPTGEWAIQIGQDEASKLLYKFTVA